MSLQNQLDELVKAGLYKESLLKNEILSLIKKKCEICNATPIDCALQPHCGDRKLLKIQIELGVQYQDLPQFCYNQQLQTVIRFMNGKVNLIEPVDVKIFLNDFINVVINEKKIKFRNSDSLYSKLIVKLSELSKNDFFIVRDERNGLGKVIFLLNGTFYFLDFDKQIAIINWHNSFVETEEELKMVLNLLAQKYKLKFEIEQELLGLWKLIFTFPKKLEIADDKILKFKQEMKKYVEYVNFYSTFDDFKLKINLKTPKNINWESEKLNVKTIKEIFKIVYDNFK
ncbi:MAG: hypothetical protein ACTSUG_16480 [Candidatus Helarchaeota archaeon]